jgi:hypothetical protein
VPVIPALRKPRQKDLEFEASLGYRAKLCLKRERERENRKIGRVECGQYSL